MNKKILEQIEQNILKLSPKFPETDEIDNYSDFLQIKNILPSYLFSEKLFLSIVRLSNCLWNSNKNISRITILETLLKYSHNTGYDSIEMNSDGKQELFTLYKKTIDETQFLHPEQIEKCRKIANRLISKFSFNEESEVWLCEKVVKYPHILNLILYYPKKSKVISGWAKQNFFKHEYRNKRSELISFLVDENEDYRFDPYILLDDFQTLNKIDEKKILDFKNELEAYEMLKTELKDLSPNPFEYPKELEWLKDDWEYDGLSFPELNFTKRTYRVPLHFSKKDEIYIPDYKKLKFEFNKNFIDIYYTTLLWGIALSRVDNSKKIELLKKYCVPQIAGTFGKICTKLEFVEPLIWLKLKLSKLT